MTDVAGLTQRAKALLERQADLEDRWACDTEGCNGMPHEGWLHRHARAEQWEPESYESWLIQAGRGYGKTRTGAETSKGWAKPRRAHIAVIGRTDREARNICFEGPAGLLHVIRPKYIKNYVRSGGDTTLSLVNGSVFRAFSAANPEALRGYAFDSAWVDEYGSYPIQTATDVWSNLWFALREAKYPRVVVTTTPRNVQHIKDLISTASVITRGSTMDNRANLSEVALAELERRYGGTRLGRQELSGELVDDVEGALWLWSMIDDARWTSDDPPDLRRIVIGVDPAGTNKRSSDETGIVVVGEGGSVLYPEFYVLEDASGRYSPDGWARVVAGLFDKWMADSVIAEVNMGYDLVESVLRNQTRDLALRSVVATRGKYIRAEPVAALYEQSRVHHVGGFGKLEDQLTTWTQDSGESPDRLDALVWAITDMAKFGPTLVQSPVNLPRRNSHWG